MDTETLISELTHDMELRGFAASTKESYRRFTLRFQKFSQDCGGGLDEDTFRKYLAHLREDCKLMPGTINMHNAGLRFLLEVTLGLDLNYKRIPRLKVHQDLPVILSKEELRRIFEHTSTLRNRAILMTIYGGGLRLFEACELRISDIDSKTMRIRVRDGKGQKERYTLLSQTNLEILREYWKAYRPHHAEGWLFLNQSGNNHVITRAIQNAFKSALVHAEISKKVSVHSLRASFATHLLEDGVDIFTVKRLMGHASLKSLTNYMGVTKFEASLKSPLDSLPKKRGRKPKKADRNA